jgi:hypothetical protein
MASQRRCRVTLVAVLCGVLGACSSGGGTGKTGAAGATGTAGTTGTAGATGTAGGGTAGATASGGAGSTGASGASGGTTGTAGSAGGGGGGGSSATTDAGAGDAPTTGAGGATACAGRAISLSANGTGHDSDAARARVVIDLMMDSPLGNVPRTIEFWFYVKPTDWVAEVNEIFVLGVGGGQQQLGLDFGTPPVAGMAMNHATLNPYTNGIFDDDSGKYLGITSTDPQWIHVAMTWDMLALRTYVNGVVRITTMATGNQMLKTAVGPLVMGCNPPYFGCFNGLFDELRVWSVARTADEIMANYDKGVVGNEAGLVGYWKFDDAAGSPTAADSVTTAGHTAHPGVLTSATDAGAPTFVTPDPPAPVACP